MHVVGMSELRCWNIDHRGYTQHGGEFLLNGTCSDEISYEDIELCDINIYVTKASEIQTIIIWK